MYEGAFRPSLSNRYRLARRECGAYGGKGVAIEVEEISAEGRTLAFIVSVRATPDETNFVTPPETNLQVGFVVKAQGSDVPRHRHRPVERRIVGTSEVLIVQQGSCELTIYDEDEQLVATREVGKGDILVLVGGGHAIRIREDTVFIEVKQGPYPGLEEKEPF